MFDSYGESRNGLERVNRTFTKSQMRIEDTNNDDSLIAKDNQILTK